MTLKENITPKQQKAFNKIIYLWSTSCNTYDINCKSYKDDSNSVVLEVEITRIQKVFYDLYRSHTYMIRKDGIHSFAFSSTYHLHDYEIYKF